MLTRFFGIALQIVRTNNFNLLRLIFALLVIVSHSPELADGNRSRELLTWVFGTMSFGELAVAGFFILSGYLIVKSWESEPKVFSFLKKRVLRIYPAFVVASLISTFIVGPLGSNAHEYFAHFWKGGYLASLLLLQMPVTPDTFKGSYYAVVNGAMWTISLEFVCYLTVILAGRCGFTRRPVIWVAFGIALTILALAGQLGATLPIPEKFNAIIKLGMYFFSGSCFYIFQDRIRYTNFGAICSLTALIILMFFDYLAVAGVAVLGAYLLFYIALQPIQAVVRFNKLPDVSYGVYLYAWPIQKLMLWNYPEMSPWLLSFETTAFCLIFGAMSWYAIEKPALSFKPLKRKSVIF